MITWIFLIKEIWSGSPTERFWEIEWRERSIFEEEIQITPHVPQQVPQLFILMIDSSGSMNTKDKNSDQSRMEKVKEALLLPNVQNAFFQAIPKTSFPFLNLQTKEHNH